MTENGVNFTNPLHLLVFFLQKNTAISIIVSAIVEV